MYLLQMSRFALGASDHALSLCKPAGRSEIRLHHRASDAIGACAVTKAGQEPRYEDGVASFPSEESIEYLKEAVEKCIKAGIPPVFARGFSDLFDVLDQASASATADAKVLQMKQAGE